MSALTPCDISEKLLRSLELIGDEAPVMLPSLDLAANYYAVKSDENRLQADVASILRQGHLQIPPAYGELALLLQATLRPPRRPRTPALPPSRHHLSARHDDRAGLPARRHGIHTPRPVGLGQAARHQPLRPGRARQRRFHPRQRAQRLPPLLPARQPATTWTASSRNATPAASASTRPAAGSPDATQLATILADLREPILYKLHGSLDVRDSFTLSTEQYYEAVSRSPSHKAVPEQIGQILSNTPIVCLGSRILDPDFRLSYYLLRECLDVRRGQIRRFAVHPRDLGDQRDCSHQMGLRAWSRLANWATTRYGVEMLDMRSEVFLKQLRGGSP
jgi:hypothetical protein